MTAVAGVIALLLSLAAFVGCRLLAPPLPSGAQLADHSRRARRGGDLLVALMLLLPML